MAKGLLWEAATAVRTTNLDRMRDLLRTSKTEFSRLLGHLQCKVIAGGDDCMGKVLEHCLGQFS